jgi:predicted LPLAT superfamily acyltransferase
MSDEVYAAFKRVVQNRKKPKVEEMIDGYTGFLFLDKRGKPMMPYQWENAFSMWLRSTIEFIECNFQR